jgi:hypothetical protein
VVFAEYGDAVDVAVAADFAFVLGEEVGCASAVWGTFVDV